MLMDRKQKRPGTNSGESGARNMEAESIGSGAESTGGCVKLKTVTEIVHRESLPAVTMFNCFYISRSTWRFPMSQDSL